MKMSHSPQRTMVSVVVMVVTLLLASSGPGRCASPPHNDYDDDYDEEGGCHPEEADHCFADVNENLMCNLGKPNAGRNCTNRDAQNLCDGMGDALECSEDILFTCSREDGYYTFETWLTGLEAVMHDLCYDPDHMETINVLLKGSKCFRLKRFINCLEDRASLTHMADLLTTTLDLKECNKIQVAIAACIEDSEKSKKKCQGTSEAITQALIAFFSATKCGQPDPTPPPPPCLPPAVPGSTNTTINTTNTTSNEENTEFLNTTDNTTTTTSTNNTPKQNTTTNTITTTTTTTPKASPQTACKKDLSTSGTPTASTVVVTLLVTLVLVGLLAVVLVRKGVLIIRTDFNRHIIGLDAMDNEERDSAYDRL
ncbi:uncharacterized protein LOC127005395 [Eriocheir sinensis]|uniref:uncharacterized protein LOC127005395 n=1 Tax=Eriocheir sinensis TaxID=95602 RepID=UPI0021C73726|nr:uncharacterized protein LOC127005395 [Eriocheir sinensis]